MWKLSRRRLIREVKFMRAELRIDQLSDLKFSIDMIMARGMYVSTLWRKKASLNTPFMMLKLWILLSSD